ncbi:MAG TPA: hypothetical protein VLW54_12705 [Candidatus Acidoferrales bacterium]|nr:hypothetical protein [Candidatus Acidoferrales bacterium]
MAGISEHDYLWEAVGEADPEIARLEQALRNYRFREPARPLPALVPAAKWQRMWWSRAFRIPAYAAAAALLVFLVCPWAVRRMAYPGDHCGAYCMTGAPRVNGRAVVTSAEIGSGGVIETDNASEAELRIGWVGRVKVLPDSRVRVAELRRGRYRLALERGKISARTLAPPFTFAVDTPGPTAYDVGCAFTLETDEHGSGLLRVTSGWVQLELEASEVMIPAGAASLLRPGATLGTPYFEDAPEAFRAALERLDFGAQDAASRDAALAELLAAARPRDVFSFMELLRTARGGERRRLVDRGMELLPPPPGVTRAGLLRGDEAMLHAWRGQLGIPEAKQWWLDWRDILPQ